MCVHGSKNSGRVCGRRRGGGVEEARGPRGSKGEGRARRHLSGTPDAGAKDAATMRLGTAAELTRLLSPPQREAVCRRLKEEPGGPQHSRNGPTHSLRTYKGILGPLIIGS